MLIEGLEPRRWQRTKEYEAEGTGVWRIRQEKSATFMKVKELPPALCCWPSFLSLFFPLLSSLSTLFVLFLFLRQKSSRVGGSREEIGENSSRRVWRSTRDGGRLRQ